jgi:hypothetical protein
MESEANREQSSAAESANNTPSLSKAEAIASLKQTIQQLEAIVTQLDTIDTDTVAIDSSVNTLVTTTQELATVITIPTPQITSPEPPQTVTEPTSQTDIATPAPSPTPRRSPRGVDTSAPSPPTRRSPRDIDTSTPSPPTRRSPKPQRNNRLIAGIIATVIIIGLGIWWWLPDKPVTLISRSDTDTEIATDTVASEPEIIEPEVSDIPVTDSPEASEDSIENLPTDTESEPEASIDIPLELEAPNSPQQLKLETVEPEIVLTPEQSLIAALQNRVTEITQDYAEDSIVSVEADFRQSSLSVILSNLWYELNESRQNKLANDILKRSRQLDFQKLTIKDPEGILIARNPVIGNSAIVVQRSKE